MAKRIFSIPQTCKRTAEKVIDFAVVSGNIKIRRISTTPSVIQIELSGRADVLDQFRNAIEELMMIDEFTE